MSIGDDPALGRLTKYFRQTHDGHGHRVDDVRKHLAGPTGRKLVDVADQDQRRMLRHSPQDCVHEGYADHPGSIYDEQIALSGLSSLRRKPPCLGSTSSRRWMVLAAHQQILRQPLGPARPVGAASAISMSLAPSTLRIESISVVLPTPGRR